MKDNAVKLSPRVDVMLKDIVEVRNNKSVTSTTKINVVADLINKAHRKECGKC
ncbi:MAG: hypothetical protein KAT04_14435 [Methylococcales bacterium]|nr:hypothetical protein [Methylococcales bacterium]